MIGGYTHPQKWGEEIMSQYAEIEKGWRKGMEREGWGKWEKGEDEERVKLRRRMGWETGNVGRGKMGGGG